MLMMVNAWPNTQVAGDGTDETERNGHHDDYRLDVGPELGGQQEKNGIRSGPVAIIGEQGKE